MKQNFKNPIVLLGISIIWTTTTFAQSIENKKLSITYDHGQDYEKKRDIRHLSLPREVERYGLLVKRP